MYLALNIAGIVIFLAIGLLFSHDRKKIDWKSIGILTALNLALAWILTGFPWGRAAIQAAAAAFNELVDVAWRGINFALANWVGAEGVDPQPVNFVTSALLPILLILPIFDILTYIGFLPWVIKWVGRGLSLVTRQPKFETFYSIEMMFLGNTEAPVVSKLQLQRMSPARNVVIAMMTMSCVTASILASYIRMMPAEYILTAVPLNCLNALIVTSMLYPVGVPAEEDVIHTYGDGLAENAGERLVPVAAACEESATARTAETAPAAAAAAKLGLGAWLGRIFKHDQNRTGKEPFFSFLGDSILNGGRLVLIVTANVIAFVALAALIDKVLGVIWSPLSLESVLGVFMYAPSLLLGLDPSSAWDMSQIMGLKLVTNEFVAMGRVMDTVTAFPPHYRAVLTVFLTSFANFGTLGMVIGTFKGIVDKERNDLIAKNVGRMFLSGILVSLLSAGMAGLFVW